MKPTVFAFFLSCVLVLSASGLNNITHQTLAGQWRFNPTQSDEPQAKLDAALDSGGILGTMKRKYANEALQRFITASETLTITCQPDAVTLNGKGTPSRTLYLDGRKQQFESPNQSKVESTASWQNNQLVIRSLTDKGANVTQSYTRLPNTGQLQLLVRIESSHLKSPLIIRNIYDPVK